MPWTLALSLNACSSLFQLSSRRALSRLRSASPLRFSKRSTNTSTRSPIWTSEGCPGVENSLSGTRPSAFSPTSTTASSLSIAITVPVTTEPSIRSLWRNVSSSSAAKSSVEGVGSVVISSWVMNSVLALSSPPRGAVWRRYQRLGSGWCSKRRPIGDLPAQRINHALARRHRRVPPRRRSRRPVRWCRSQTRHSPAPKARPHASDHARHAPATSLERAHI